jgi:hypothetical protein
LHPKPGSKLAQTPNNKAKNTTQKEVESTMLGAKLRRKHKHKV